jgi:outer membrane protein TolC
LLSPKSLFLFAFAPLLAFAGEVPASTVVNPAPDPAEPLIRQAAMHSPSMLEQELRIAQADAFRFRGWRQYMPYIRADYQAGFFKLLSAADPNAQKDPGQFGGSYTVSAAYPLYQWGGIEAEKKSTLARENLTRDEAVIAWRALVNDIRAKFNEAVVAKARIALLEYRIIAVRARQERTEQEFRLGRIIDAQRKAGLLEVRNHELELSNRKIELATLISRLRGLSGAENYGITDLPSDLPDIEWDDNMLAARLNDFRKIGIEESPENRQAGHAIEMYENQRVMAESRELPSFNLGASVTQSPVQTPQGMGMQTYIFAGLMGSWNIFDRQATQEGVRSIRVAQRLVETRLNFGNRQRFTELDNAAHQLKASRSARDLRREILKLREEALDAMKQRVKLGLAQKEELTAAEDAILSAKLDLTNDRSIILNAYHAFMAGILLSPTDQLYTAPTNDR